MKQLRVLLLYPGWDASPSQGYPQQYVTGTHLNTLLKRDKVEQSFMSKKAGLSSGQMVSTLSPHHLNIVFTSSQNLLRFYDRLSKKGLKKLNFVSCSRNAKIVSPVHSTKVNSRELRVATVSFVVINTIVYCVCFSKFAPQMLRECLLVLRLFDWGFTCKMA